MNTVEGINELRSISFSGASFVVATFNLNRDIDIAAQDVRDRVAAVLARLPLGTDPPIITKMNNDSAPVLSVALSANRTVRELTELANQVVRVQLERSSEHPQSGVRKRTRCWARRWASFLSPPLIQS